MRRVSVTARPTKEGTVDLVGLVRDHVEAENEHNVDRVMASVADDACFKTYRTGERLDGKVQIRRYYAEMFEQIPDLRIEIQETMKDEEKREVFARCKITGTDSAYRSCIELANKCLESEEAILYKFDEAGKISARTHFFARSGLDLYRLALAHVEAENNQSVDIEKRADLTMATVADDAYYLIYPLAQELRGTENLRQYYADSFTALPDMRIEITHMIKDEEQNEVFCQYRITGTDRGHLQGLAATGKKIEYYGCIIYKFNEGGKLQSEITYFETTEVLSTMGLIKPPTTPLGLIALIFPQSPIFTLKTIFYNLFNKKGSNPDAKRGS
jgi:steroid delta-isomerase-like uncharacterized protein